MVRAESSPVRDTPVCITCTLVLPPPFRPFESTFRFGGGPLTVFFFFPLSSLLVHTWGCRQDKSSSKQKKNRLPNLPPFGVFEQYSGPPHTFLKTFNKTLNASSTIFWVEKKPHFGCISKIFVHGKDHLYMVLALNPVERHTGCPSILVYCTSIHRRKLLPSLLTQFKLAYTVLCIIKIMSANNSHDITLFGSFQHLWYIT